MMTEDIHEMLPCIGGPFAGLQVPVRIEPDQRFVNLSRPVPDGCDGEGRPQFGAIRARYLIERVDGMPHHLTYLGAPR